jgi:hypothetical protein
MIYSVDFMDGSPLLRGGIYRGDLGTVALQMYPFLSVDMGLG